MQKYKFYFEMRVEKGKKWYLKRKKMVLFIGDSWLAKLEQQTGETRTAD